MTNQIKNILIPVNFSETSLNSLNTALHIAKRHQANLHLLYTKDIINYYPQIGHVAVLEPMVQDIWEKDIFHLEKIALSIRHTHAVNCTVDAVSGHMSTVIAERSADLKADMIVLGTDSDISDHAYLTDSLPYKVLQKVSCHVLTVPAKRAVNNFDRVVFPVMSHEHSANKLGLAQNVIEKNNASVSVIGLVKRDDLNMLTAIWNISEQVKGRLKKITQSVTKKSVYTMDIAKDLIGLAKEEHAELIVVSININRNLKEFFFGNFTQRMIRNGEVPVLFIRDFPEMGTSVHVSESSHSAALQLNYY